MIQENKQRILTGIKPTGRPHLGNYLGMIKPALADMANNLDGQKSAENFLFIADIHSIGSVGNAARLRDYTYDLAASLLAAGLDPASVTMFRESDVPEISELSAYLMHVTPKGLMNRAHAYKAALDANREQGKTGDDQDIGVNMGLYTYPILMAADILAFNTTHVPVGRDQVQHVEFARDIGGYFNNTFGETFVLPQHKVKAEVAIVPGIDGRKMSKSYNNHIPIFDDAATITSLVKKVVTDSARPDEAKDPETNNLFQIYKAVATRDEAEALATRFRATGDAGIGYGEAKKLLAERIVAEFSKRAATYHHYMNNKAELDAILAAAATRARAIASVKLAEVRKAIGFG